MPPGSRARVKPWDSSSFKKSQRTISRGQMTTEQQWRSPATEAAELWQDKMTSAGEQKIYVLKHMGGSVISKDRSFLSMGRI